MKSDYVSSLDEKNIQQFLNKSTSNILVKRNIERQIADTTWIDMVEEAIPYLDNIIRNPRRFIVQEENIVPIEKAKVVTEESIRHLAQHTNLIQDVKEDGSIIPIKLLNVYREETYDLYENRFIKSLVDNLYQFVETKLNESDQKSFAKVSNIVSFSGSHKSGRETVKVNVNLESRFEDELTIVSKNGHSLEARIEHIKDVIGAFKSSTFIKSLKESSPVRSPIRKTNVILKEQNFIKALELWEFLEKNAIKPSFSVEKKYEEVADKNIKDIYDLAFFMENDCLKENRYEVKTNANFYIQKMVNDFVFDTTASEAEFKKLMLKEFKEAKKRKEKIKSGIDKKFSLFFEEWDKNKKKAVSLLK